MAAALEFTDLRLVRCVVLGVVWLWKASAFMSIEQSFSTGLARRVSVDPSAGPLAEDPAWEPAGRAKKNGKLDSSSGSNWKDELQRTLKTNGGGPSPPGTLAASREADYELWISGQLRLNRVQLCSTTVKESVADRLATLELEGVEHMLGQLVQTSTGVRDRAQTSLLSTVPVWHQLLPLVRCGRRCVFKEPSARQLARWRRSDNPGTPRWLVERERRWLGPLLTTAAVFEGRALNLDTVRLRRLTWGGSTLKLFGFLRIPLVAAGQTQSLSKSIRILYVDADFVVAIERPGGVLVFAAPHLATRAKRPPLHFMKRKSAFRRRAKFASMTHGNNLDHSTPFGIGDLAWTVDTAMDVDDDRMQSFLDKPHDVKGAVSVQDMLDNNLPNEDDAAPPSTGRRGALSPRKI